MADYMPIDPHPTKEWEARQARYEEKLPKVMQAMWPKSYIQIAKWIVDLLDVTEAYDALIAKETE